MAPPTTSQFSLISTLALFIFISSLTPSTQAFSRRITKEEMGLKAQQSLTHIKFYFRDYVSGSNQTALRIAQSKITDSNAGNFGALVMIDDPLSEGPEVGSKVVGRAQGMYGFADQQTAGLIMVMNLYFNEGQYNGSTLSVIGRNEVMLNVRELAIVGGSGVFRFASGYAQAHTIDMLNSEGASIVEYNVYVSH